MFKYNFIPKNKADWFLLCFFQFPLIIDILFNLVVMKIPSVKTVCQQREILILNMSSSSA